MSDPFHDLLARKLKPGKAHGERKHSKFSASGADRWFQCPGSVKLSEGLPDKTSKWAEEGTRAHEILEALMRIELSGNDAAAVAEFGHVLNFNPALEFTMKQHREMLAHAGKTASNILRIGEKLKAEVMVETRIHLDFIHPEMFGTFDGAVLDYFGTLCVFDFKYGAGHPVSPRENLQMIFYALGLAHKYDWNFTNVRMYIDQPRIKGYDGPLFWELPIEHLREYVWAFEGAVERVEVEPDKLVEGGHCKWCKAKGVCPAKKERRNAEAQQIFVQEVNDSIFD